ncbi:multidrug ABC transporter ATP-binding protein [Spirochaetia bacterium]|nr:multidrug ABC transporter ATP-binding protein [Spirochaetia bacterium]
MKTTDKNKSSFAEFKTLSSYFYRYRFKYLAGFICLFTVDAAQLLIPQFTKRAIDIISLGDFSIRSIIKLSICMVAAMLVISSGRFLWRLFIHGSSRRIEAELRGKLFDHFLILSWDFYQENKIGDLIARSTNDIGAIRMAIGWGFVAGIDGTVMAIALIIVMFFQSWNVAIFAILPLPFITILIIIFGKAVGKRFVRAQEAYSGLTETVQETFAGSRVIKSFVKEAWFIKKFAGNNDDYRAASMSVVKLHGFFMPLITFLSGFTSLIVILVGGRRVVMGLMSAGDLVALFTYVQMLVWPMLGAGFTVNIVQRGAVSLRRLNEVFNSEPSIKNIVDTKKNIETPIAKVDSAALNIIEIKNLNFAYQKKNILNEINLSVEQGSWLGILGKTGSGKSTFLKLLPRLLDPPDASIFIKGLDIKKWNIGELRSLFGMSPQDSFMFSDSIKSNILYGTDNKNINIKDIIHLASLERDIEIFNERENTVIGERGLTLSGGQKQRLSIARAAVSNPEILLLDDSLSAVDAETETKIIKQLEHMRKGKTTIIVSHKVSAFTNAGKIAVFEDGRIVECGTHEQLLESGGYYAKTAKLQQLAGVIHG